MHFTKHFQDLFEVPPLALLQPMSHCCSRSTGSSVGGFLTKGQKLFMTNYRDGLKASKITFFEGSYQWCSAQTDWMYSVCSAGASFIFPIHSHTQLPPKNQNKTKIKQTNQDVKFSKMSLHSRGWSCPTARRAWAMCVSGISMLSLPIHSDQSQAPSSTTPAVSAVTFWLQAPGLWKLWMKRRRRRKGWTKPRAHSWVHSSEIKHHTGVHGLVTRQKFSQSTVHLWTNAFASPHLFPNIFPLHETLSTDDWLWNTAMHYVWVWIGTCILANHSFSLGSMKLQE